MALFASTPCEGCWRQSLSSPRARLTSGRSSFLPCLAVNVRLHARSDAVVEAHHRGDQAAALIFDFALTNNCAAVAFTECDREQVKVHAGETFWLRRRRPRRRPPPWMERKHRASELTPRQTALRAPVSPRISGVQCHGGNRRLRVQASILRRTSSSRREVPLLEALACGSGSRTHASRLEARPRRGVLHGACCRAVPPPSQDPPHATVPRAAATVSTASIRGRHLVPGKLELVANYSGAGKPDGGDLDGGAARRCRTPVWTLLHLPSGGGR